VRRLCLPLLLLLAACGSTDDLAGPTARLEPAWGTEVARRVSVVLTGGLQVTSVRLRGGGFVQVPAQPASGTTPLTLDLAYGPVLCAGRAAPTAIEVGTPDGEVVVPVEQDQVLPALRAAECAQQPPAP
jgi:hypothetical protein